MKKSYQKDKFTRESIIGLGEDSFRKNYYSELQTKLVELEKTNARNRAIINTIPDIMLIADDKGNMRPFSSLRNGRSKEANMILGNVSIMCQIREGLRVVSETGTLSTIFFQIQRNNEVIYFEARLNSADSEEILIIIRDITKQIELSQKLREQANQDSLTKMFNRRVFEMKLAELNGAANKNVSITIIDIDGLKMLNDTLGHQIGDQVIVIVGSLIDKYFGNKGLSARLSGDEFGVIMENVTEAEIEVLMQGLSDEIDRINEQSDTYRISVSYGYALRVSEIINPQLLFKEADNKMYQNKMFKTSSVKNSFVKTLMKALEAKDFITEGHADRLDVIASQIGRSVGLMQNQMDKLKLLSKFHDIGKVGIPDLILKKPGKLDKNEFEIMKTHTDIGKRIAQESVDLYEIADLIFYHHEKWDGSGYPLGLSGEEIPIECRILAIADAYDAMTNDRPYRQALPKDIAIKEILDNSGSQFEPMLVDIFLYETN